MNKLVYVLAVSSQTKLKRGLKNEFWYLTFDFQWGLDK